jgi:hypothetical protein
MVASSIPGAPVCCSTRHRPRDVIAHWLGAPGYQQAVDVLAKQRGEDIDLLSQCGIVGLIGELELEEARGPDAEVGVCRSRRAEVVAQNIEGNRARQVDNFDASARGFHQALRLSHRCGSQTLLNVLPPDYHPHVGRVPCVLLCIRHAEEEGMAAHDDVELIVVGVDEDFAERHDLLHIAVAGHHREVAQGRSWPDVPDNPEDAVHVRHAPT